MNSIWIRSIAEVLTTALMHFVWQGAALALILLVIIKVLKVKSARSRYLFSVGTLLMMGLAPLVTISLHFAGMELARQPATAADLSHSSVAAHLGGALVDDPGAHVHDEITSLPFPRAEACLLSLWLIGVAVLGARMSIGYGVTLWMRGACQPLPAQFEARAQGLGTRLCVEAGRRVLACAHVGQAVAVGFVQPIVLIPTAWLTQLPPDVLEVVIAHELAHIRRFDLWVNLVQRLIETFLFYHPAVWWLSHRIQFEREMCCDELAVGLFDPATYARSLESAATLARGELVLGTAMLGGSKMRLLRRVRYVLGAEIDESTGTCWAAGFVAMILPFAAAAALPLATAPVATTVAMADESQRPANNAATASGKFAGEGPGKGVVADDPKGADLKIRDIGRKFDVLMQAKNWDAAENLAIDTAKKYGERDELIQSMLLESLNAKRRAKGLPVIRVDYLTPNGPDTKTLRVYQIEDLPFWTKDGRKQSPDLLIKYLTLAVDPPSWESGSSRAAFDARRFSLIVSTTDKNHKEIDAFFGRLRTKPTPENDWQKPIHAPK